MLMGYLLYEPYVDQLFGPDGLGAYTMGHDHLIRDHTWTTWWVLIGSAASFTLGFATPLSGALLIGSHLVFIEPGRFFSWGWVPTVPAFLAYLTLGPSGRSHSVDAWLIKKWRGIQPLSQVPAWSIRLIQLHIIAIYLGAGWHRVGDIAWLRGEMVYDAVTYAFFSRFPNVDWSMFRWPLVASNYIVWSLELLAPLGLVLAETRLVFAIGLFAMHLGLELTSTIGLWQLMMMSVLFTYFPESWSKRLLGHRPKQMNINLT